MIQAVAMLKTDDGRQACTVCGEEVAIHQLDGLRRCPGCHWDRYLPRNYQAREKYEWCEADGVARAGCRPRTGKLILDERQPGSIRELAMTMGPAALAAMLKREQQAGLLDDV